MEVQEQSEKTYYQGTQYVISRLGESLFGVDISYVHSVIRIQHMTRIPKMPSYVKGIINLRGEVLPVVDLGLRMGYPEVEYSKTSRIVILKTAEDGFFGMIVDEVKEVANLPKEEMDFTICQEEGSEASFLIGVGKKNKDLIGILNVNKIAIEE